MWLIYNDFVGGWEKMMQKSRPFLLACSNRWIYLCITNFIPTKNPIEKFDGTQNNDSYCLAKHCAPPDLVILLFHDPLQLQHWLRPSLSWIHEVWVFLHDFLYHNFIIMVGFYDLLGTPYESISKIVSVNDIYGFKNFDILVCLVTAN